MASLRDASLFFLVIILPLAIVETLFAIVLIFSGLAWKLSSHNGTSRHASHAPPQKAQSSRSPTTKGWRWPLHYTTANTLAFKAQVVQVLASSFILIGGVTAVLLPFNGSQSSANCYILWKVQTGMYLVNTMSTYLFLVLKSRITSEDFKMFDSPSLSLLASVLTVVTYCFPIIIVVAVYFAEGSFETDGEVHVCSMRILFLIPVILGMLDAVLNAGFFYLFYKPLRDIIRHIASEIHQKSSDDEKMRKIGILEVAKRNFTATCSSVSITVLALVLMSLSNTVDQSASFSIFALTTIGCSSFVNSIALLYCMIKAWRWVGFSSEVEIAQSRMSQDASVDAVAIRNVPPPDTIRASLPNM
jgi:hypothetical protein